MPGPVRASEGLGPGWGMVWSRRSTELEHPAGDSKQRRTGTYRAASLVAEWLLIDVLPVGTPEQSAQPSRQGRTLIVSEVQFNDERTFRCR